MPRPAPPDDGIQLESLTALLGESYTASYKVSSLKVRRRYRKLLVALEAACRQRKRATEAREPVAARRTVQR